MSIILLMAAAYVGPVGAFLHVFLAVPLALAGYTAGIVAALLVLLISLVVQFMTAGEAALLLYLAQFGLPGLCLVYALRHNIGWPRAVFYALLVGIAALGALATYSASMAGSSVSTLVADYIDAEMRQIHVVYSQAGIEGQQLKELAAVVENTAIFLKRAYVGITVAALGLVYLVTVVVLYTVGKGRYTLPGIAFHHFKVAEPVIWLLIGAGFALLLPLGWLQIAALNILTVLLPLYFVQGIAIVAFYFKKKAFSFLACLFAYTILLIVNPLPLMVAALGIFDLWFDFRKPRVKTT
ncbi:MAG: DUF2232 domain-containing protein, partial [Desulfuromonadaceae bacterium]|nr:DUF2232 domain-containing protein [Desulfuromonadaceae bacterium]